MIPRRVTRLAPLGAGVVLVALLAACGSAGPHTSGATETLTLYNGQHAQTTDALVEAFERATHIRVSVRSDDEDLLAEQIVEAGKSSPADVIYTENSPALEYLESKDLLAKVPAATLGQVPASDSSPRGDWVGVTARVSVLVYNTHDLSSGAVPRSILGLGSPEWRNKLAIAPGETDFQPIVTAVDRAYGEKTAIKWLEAIKSNGSSHEYADNETITSAVNSGQAEIGVINQYYWYRLRAEIGNRAMHSAIAYFSPRNPGYVEDISGAGILRGTHHMKAAQEFLAFLVSAKAQRIIARSDSFEYPLRSGVAAAPGMKPLSAMKPYPITITELGTGSTAVSLMTQVGLLP